MSAEKKPIKGRPSAMAAIWTIVALRRCSCRRPQSTYLGAAVLADGRPARCGRQMRRLEMVSGAPEDGQAVWNEKQVYKLQK